jgi:hypothetical protein
MALTVPVNGLLGLGEICPWEQGQEYLPIEGSSDEAGFRAVDEGRRKKDMPGRRKSQGEGIVPQVLPESAIYVWTLSLCVFCLYRSVQPWRTPWVGKSSREGLPPFPSLYPRSPSLKPGDPVFAVYIYIYYI